jgi:hypothetical protein
VQQQTNSSPKAFLKARRPERFSDSVLRTVSELDRSLLEYHLDSLTSRSQEQAFELFARALCEREVCPNLLPTTGPTGGGDSKADAETYPVALQLSLNWLIGIAEGANQERWAFAFSAKKQWTSKVKSDIAKIHETQRGYSKAFFVSNQAIPARKRSKVEDDLKTKYGIDVRIFDRTWILDRVFTGHHEKLAIEHLGVTALSRVHEHVGPQDHVRQEELKLVEQKITEATRIGHLNTLLVDDALEAADISRNLELSRLEIEGRYQRSDRLALKYGTDRQRVEAAYQWAYTLYFWLEDFGTFNEQYTVVEQRALGSQNVYDFEKLKTLWTCLFTAINQKQLDGVQANYNTRTTTLIAELVRLKDELNRPSTSLQAETLLLEIRLVIDLKAGNSTENHLQALQEVVIRSEGLIGYPLQSLVRILLEIGSTFEDSEAYNRLFETLLETSAKRDGEISAARMLLTRGEQLIQKDKPVNAIATLGRALTKLYKDETKKEIVTALYYCGCAYADAGLLWAARGTLLAAASIATDDFRKYGAINVAQFLCMNRLKWIELQLGRLPQILTWHESASYVGAALVVQGVEESLITSQHLDFDSGLTRLFICSDPKNLSSLDFLPEILDNLGLVTASDALLFLLGYEDRWAELAESRNESCHELAMKWHELPVDESQSKSLIFGDQRNVELHSSILGCEITVDCNTSDHCIAVAESFLAALEALLATGRLHDLLAREPELRIQIQESQQTTFPFSLTIEERAGVPYVCLCCSEFNPHNLGIDEQTTIKEAINQASIQAMSEIILAKDIETTIYALFVAEAASERASHFTSTFGFQANVLGHTPKITLASWKRDAKTSYPIQRDIPWQPDPPPNISNTKTVQQSTPASTDSKLPFNLLDPDKITHQKIRTISLIRTRLWERAGWAGTMFVTYEQDISPPILGLIFKNPEIGREIFHELRNALGSVDEMEQLRISIIRGIHRLETHAYRVVIGSNVVIENADSGLHLMHSRMNEMIPHNSKNLDRFLHSLGKNDAFWLVPAYASEDFDGSQTPQLDLQNRLLLHQVVLMQAWQIGPNDPECVAIHADDDPIIPESEINPPIKKLLELRALRSSNND